MTPLAIAAPLPHIANDGLAAFMDMHMLDPHVLACAMLETLQKLHLNRESLRQAARRRSQAASLSRSLPPPPPK